MTALKVRPYEPPAADRPERSFMELVEGLYKQSPPGWPEIRSGDRGIDISRCRFEGLRDLGTGADPSGGYLVKSTQPATFFDAMLAASVVGKAGAKDDRPKGDWSAIPVVASVGDLAWVDPNAGPINETSMTFGSRSRRPHLGVFSADITRVLRVSTGGLAEKVVLSTGARVLAAGLDKAALVGTGLDFQPRGILNSPISTTSGATFSTTTAAELIRLVEDVNAVPSAFIISPTVAKLLRTRPRFTSTDTPILSGGKISDLPVYVSTAMPDDQVLLGDFSRLTICSEAIQLLVNPYKESHIGTLEITFYLFADTVLEYASAFAAATSVS